MKLKRRSSFILPVQQARRATLVPVQVVWVEPVQVPLVVRLPLVLVLVPVQVPAVEPVVFCDR